MGDWPSWVVFYRRTFFVVSPECAPREFPRAGADPGSRAEDSGRFAVAHARRAEAKCTFQLMLGFRTRARAGVLEISLAVATATRMANRVIIVMDEAVMVVM